MSYIFLFISVTCDIFKKVILNNVRWHSGNKQENIAHIKEKQKQSTETVLGVVQILSLLDKGFK